MSVVTSEPSREQLVGRERECDAIDRLLAGARHGRSGSLVVRGEAGMGKTSLLRHALDGADGMTALSVTGVEAESDLDFAGLHSLVRPVVGQLGRLPDPQRAALAAALGLAPAGGSDRFLVSAGVLSLLAAAADERPLLCLVDDAQWLDVPSAEAVVFAARRLGAEGVAILFAAREGESRRFAAPALPELALGGVDRRAALALLDRSALALSPRVRERLLVEAAGNPLALLELPAGLSDAQLAGRAALPEAVPLSARLRAAFASRVQRLPPAARSALLLAAADDGGELAAVLRALDELGLPADALDPAEAAGLVAIGEARLAFRHPLMRSAVYEAATFAERRRVHRALADAYAADRQGERGLWHRAAAAVGADEELAAALEAAAERSQRRGGHASAASAYERAAKLSEIEAARARRLGAGARAAFVGGQVARADDLVARALPIADGSQRPLLLGLRGLIEGFAGSLPDAVATLLEAVELSDDASWSLELLLEAGALTTHLGDVERLAALCRRATRIAPVSAADRFIVTLLTAAGAELAGDVAGARGLSAEAIELAERLDDARCLLWVSAHASRVGSHGDGLPHATRAVAIARERALVSTLPYALQAQAFQLVGASRFELAYSVGEEGRRLALDLGQLWPASWVLADLATVDALRGDEAQALAHVAELEALVPSSGARLLRGRVARALGMLDLGLGRPAEALERLLASVDAVRPESDPLFALGVPDAVEAAVRADRLDAVAGRLAQFEAWVERFPNPARLALRARCRALADPADAERHHRAALADADALSPFNRARTELLYGEWLRRGRRRTEARPALRSALERFEEMGARPWAARARAELRASGETARRRDPSTRDQLTPRELQVARLVAEGMTNPDVAAQLFLSSRTVDFHLRNVFAKLQIASRAALARVDLGEG